MGSNGRAYWRLKCLSNKSDIFVQGMFLTYCPLILFSLWRLNGSCSLSLNIDFGTGDTSASDEKWFAFEEEQKEVIEKHINKLR